MTVAPDSAGLAELEPAVDGAARARAVGEARQLVLDGESARQAAARVAAPLGVTGRTVMRWAATAGQPLGTLSRDTRKTRLATEMWRLRGGYSAVRLISLCDRLLGAVEAQVDVVEPGELKDLAVIFGICADKRPALEDRAAQQAALSDPDYWRWLAEQHRREEDPLVALSRPAPPFAVAPERVTPTNYYLAADALARLDAPGGGHDENASTGVLPRPVTAPRRRTKKAPAPPAGGSPSERELAAELALLRGTGNAPMAKRLEAVRRLADAGWGPAADQDDLEPEDR